MEGHRGPREPNRRLAELIAEAGCSNAGLARRVNLAGAELGLDLRYDKTSVARWLRGQQPRATTPALIAEALGRKLGRPVTVEEIGMVDERDGSSSLALGLAADTTEAIAVAAGLWRADAAGREQLRAASFAVSAMVGPSRDWLIMPEDPLVARSMAAAKNGHAPLRVGMSDVAAVRAATEGFRGLDHRFGGGHVRVLAVRYLDGVVTELLRGTYPERVGRQLFGAAAALTELAGYLACDTGRLGLAQRYYIQALRLSQAAGDRAHGGHILSAMSHLANSLGAPRETVQLARSADEGARGTASPHVRAEFLCAEARGRAGAGPGHRRTGAQRRRGPGLVLVLRPPLHSRHGRGLPPGPGAAAPGRRTGRRRAGRLRPGQDPAPGAEPVHPGLGPGPGRRGGGGLCGRDRGGEAVRPGPVGARGGGAARFRQEAGPVCGGGGNP